MTKQQQTCIDNAIKNLQTARKWLDQAMYYSGDIPDSEHTKLRAAYDKICEAIDKL